MTACALPGCNLFTNHKYCSQKHGDRHRKQRQRKRISQYCYECGAVGCPHIPKSKKCLPIRIKALSDRDTRPGEMSRCANFHPNRDIRHKNRDENDIIMSRSWEKDTYNEHNRDIDRDNRDTVTSRFENFPGTKIPKNPIPDLPPIRGKPEKSLIFEKSQAQKNIQNHAEKEEILESAGKHQFYHPPKRGDGTGQSSMGVREDPQISILLESWRWHQFSFKINYDEPMDNGLLQSLQDFLRKEKNLIFQKEALKNTFRIKKTGVKALNANTTAALYYSTRSLEMRFSAFSSTATWDQVKGACLEDFIYYCNQAAPILDLHNRKLDFETIHINRGPEAAHEDPRTAEKTVEISKDRHFKVPVTRPNGSTYIIRIDYSLGDIPELETQEGRTFDGLPDPDAVGEGTDDLSQFYKHVGSGDFRRAMVELSKNGLKTSENQRVIIEVVKNQGLLIEKILAPQQATQDNETPSDSQGTRTEPEVLRGYG